MKNWKCTFVAQKGNPGHKKSDFNPTKIIVVQSKFKSGARALAEEELKFWDAENPEKYRAPTIEQSTDLAFQEYQTMKLSAGSIESAAEEMTKEMAEEVTEEAHSQSIDVLDFKITQPWAVRVGITNLEDGMFKSSMAVVNCKENAIAIGNVEALSHEKFDSADNAIVYALARSIDAINEHMSGMFGHSLYSTIRIIKGYASITEQEKLKYLRETILINTGSENLTQSAIDTGETDTGDVDVDAALMEAINECINNYSGDFAPEPEECYDSIIAQVEHQGNINILAMAEGIKSVKNPFVMTHSTTCVNFVAGFKFEEETEQEAPIEREVPASEEAKAMLDRTAEESRRKADEEHPKGEPFEGYAQTVSERAPDYVYDDKDEWQSFANKILTGAKEQDDPTPQQYGEISQKLSGVFAERGIELMDGEFYSEVASEMITHASGADTIIRTLLNLREVRKFVDSVIENTKNEQNSNNDADGEKTGTLSVTTDDKGVKIEHTGQEETTPAPERGITISTADTAAGPVDTNDVKEAVNESEESIESSTNGHSERSDGCGSGNLVDAAVEDLNEKLSNLAVGELLILDDVPNEVYHRVKGISSTNIKEEMISPLYRHKRETGEIERAQKKCFDFGNYIHTLLLQPHLADSEYSYERELPEGGFDSTESMIKAIERENITRQPLATNDELKALIDAHNESLPQKLATTGSKEEIAFIFESMPEEFKLLGPDEKENATTHKKYIKAYNDTLPAKLKTTGGRESLLAEVKTFNPEFVAKEAAKNPTLPANGIKKDLAGRIRSFMPDAVFKHELDELWLEEQERGLIPVSLEDVEKGKRIVNSAMSNPAVKNWYTINNETTACERSYFTKREYLAMVDGTPQRVELILKARLDKEIGGFILDTKTIEMRLDVKEEDAIPYINKEIERRGYHISAAHYLDVACKEKFFWIFHNKLKGYEWEFIMEISHDHLELGQFEVGNAMASIAKSEASKSFKAPITQPVSENGRPLPLQSQVSSYANKRLEMFRKMNGEEM